MIKNNQKYLNRLHVVMDALVIAVSYLTAWYIQFHWIVQKKSVGVLSFRTYLYILAVAVPLLLILYGAFHLYTPKRIQSRRVEFSNIFKANLSGLLVLFFGLYLFRQQHFSRSMLLMFSAINIVAEGIARFCLRRMLSRFRRMGMNLKHMILVGYSKSAKEYIDRILQNPEWGYHVCGILADNVSTDVEYGGIKVLGDIDMLQEVITKNQLDEIAITLELSEYDKLEHIVAICEKSGVHTKFIPDYMNIIPTKPYTEDLLGLPVINIRNVPLTDTFNCIVKRTEDIVGSLVCLVLFSPIMLIAAALVKFTSEGPVFYKQERIGIHNRPFSMYKFRSMVVQPEEEEKQQWTKRKDPRVTKVGAFLRKTSIDEIPQLWNVLKGDMSLVGPRPERPQYVEKFMEEIPRYMVKHQVRPGMTGWAQMNGYRGDTSIRKRIEYDLYYIENWTIGLDIKILLMTVKKGFINENAY